MSKPRTERKAKWEPKYVELVPHDSGDEKILAELSEIIYNFYYQLRKKSQEKSDVSTKSKLERTA